MRLVSLPPGLLVLLVAVGVSTGLLENQPSIDVTNFFSVSSATSTCGADTPPTSYEEPQNSGQFQTCGSEELDFSAENVLDGNSSTKWQSENGDGTVDVNFIISEVELRICLFLNYNSLCRAARRFSELPRSWSDLRLRPASSAVPGCPSPGPADGVRDVASVRRQREQRLRGRGLLRGIRHRRGTIAIHEPNFQKKNSNRVKKNIILQVMSDGTVLVLCTVTPSSEVS